MSEWAKNKGLTTGALYNRINLLGFSIEEALTLPMGKKGKNTVRKGRQLKKTHPRGYRIWMAMRERCSNPRHNRYHLYGGKGITVCERWDSFEAFYEDMGGKPEGRSIDRIDGNGNYEPSNCKWSTPREQANNMSVNVLITRGKITRTMSQWARALGIKASTIKSRIYYGWRPEEAASMIGRPRLAKNEDVSK